MSEVLPSLDKKVIYLDQLAFSEISNVERGRRAGAPHNDFWEEARRLIDRVFLLQQAIFPYSDIHFSETLVSRAPRELRDVYEGLAGETSFEDSDQIAMRQARAYASAFLAGGSAPELDLSVDGILHGERNAWLRDIRIGLNSDYSVFAAETRADVNRAAEGMNEVVQGWIQRKPTFDEVLREELEAYGKGRRAALAATLSRTMSSATSGDAIGYLDQIMHPIVREYSMLRRMAENAGVPGDQVDLKVFECWDWPANAFQPYHRISSYLYAGLARKYSAGQKRLPTRGFLNDVKAIAAYAPYVDAMFLDNECATLLSEAPLRDDLDFKARVFSLNSKEAFLEFLRGIEGGATPEAREYACRIYGVE
jgi:hypothetical protein